MLCRCKNLARGLRSVGLGLLLAMTSARGSAADTAANENNAAITFTYNLLTGTCQSSQGGTQKPCTPSTHNSSPHAVCATNPTPEEIEQNDIALHWFNAEAQRHTRPAEHGYAGGNYGAGDAYPDARIDNKIVLVISGCDKLQYTWNKWAMFIRNLSIQGAGSTATILQNTHNGDFHDDDAGEANYDFFGDTYYGVVVSSPYANDEYGYLIDTAPAGATNVTLKRANDAVHFYVGRWVLVMSYVQDSVGSYPPNMRYYDFARIVSIDPSDGVISLDEPLKFTHRDDRPYDGLVLHAEPVYSPIGNGQVGPARIVDIDTPAKPIAVNWSISGIHFLGNPNSASVSQYDNGWTFTGIIDATGNDIVSDGSINSSQMRNFKLSNSTFAYEEADKIIANAEYINDTVTASLLHSGQLQWRVTGGRYGPGEVSCAALNCTFGGGVVLSAATAPGSDHKPAVQLDRENMTDNVVIAGAVFKGNGNLGNVGIWGWQGRAYTIGRQGLSVTDGPNGDATRLVVSKCVQDPVGCTDIGRPANMAQQVVGDWGEGESLVRRDIRSSVDDATISAVTGDARNVYIDVKGASFAAGQQIYFGRVKRLTVRDSTFRGIGNGCHPSAGPEGCVIQPAGDNIQSVTWVNNAGN